MYKLRAKRIPHNFSFKLQLHKLATKNWTLPNIYYWAKFKVSFRQVRSVQGLNINYEDHAGPLIDTYNFVENTKYLYSEKYRLHHRRKKHVGCRMTTKKSSIFFYCGAMISFKMFKTKCYVSIRGPQLTSWFLFRAYNC